MTLEDIIAFVEARETDRQDAHSLGGMPNRCWRCCKEGHSGRAFDYDIRKTSCDAFNTMCEKCNMVGHFATRCNKEILRNIWENKSMNRPVSKKATGECRSLHDCCSRLKTVSQGRIANPPSQQKREQQTPSLPATTSQGITSRLAGGAAVESWQTSSWPAIGVDTYQRTNQEDNKQLATLQRTHPRMSGPPDKIVWTSNSHAKIEGKVETSRTWVIESNSLSEDHSVFWKRTNVTTEDVENSPGQSRGRFDTPEGSSGMVALPRSQLMTAECGNTGPPAEFCLPP